ncbi:MAG: UDP-N-acetylmuramoyl-L-alanine--D-glutamate ligase [Syntrophobacterales bacterium]|nr:UDP-N-acetylmuramoyl-L-alanine--D-glutamate ligase [Syntrophobacterales bacterium]
MDFKDQNILVVGLARTGVALCRFLAEAGARVTVTDQAAPAALADRRRDIAGLGIIEDLGVAQPQWQGYDVIVLSPGVPPELPWLAAAREAGIPVVGELEVAGRFLRRPLLAVSGTNGKTTTTTLLGELLAASGIKPLVGGNIGTPVVSLLARQDEADCLVLEVSSFQLDTAPSFHPQAAALLNITPDHLDRYTGYDAYIASKAGLFRRQGAGDLMVLNADDPAVAALDQGRSRVYYFSAERSLTTGAWLSNGAIQVRLANGTAEAFPLDRIRLTERHNLENIMAALLMALDAGADPAACREVLAQFAGLPHRLEWVADLGGVAFYDDSKGTNVGAVACSLAHFDRPVVLIAGGRDKDSDFTLLNDLIRARVKALVLLGETREHMARIWHGLAPSYPADDMAAAVARAWQLADPGDVVLLSPACASFDMYRDYAHRGQTFQHVVRELEHAQRG